MAVEKKYTKDQILEKYLNIAYFGAGAYGVEAAAKRFFGVTAAELNLPQAATLAGAVQDPNSTDPNLGKKNRALLLDRRNVVLNRMAELRQDHAGGGWRRRRPRSSATRAPRCPAGARPANTRTSASTSATRS